MYTPPPEYQANPEHPPNKKKHSQLLPPHSSFLIPHSSFSFGTPIVLYKDRGSKAKNKASKHPISAILSQNSQKTPI